MIILPRQARDKHREFKALTRDDQCVVLQKGFYQIDDHEIVNDITNLQTDRAETLQTALGVWRTYVASTIGSPLLSRQSWPSPRPTENASLFLNMLRQISLCLSRACLDK